MKIVYTGLENDYYLPKRGKSFEYNNFYLSLKNLPNTEVLNFPFDRILEVGKEKFNEELLEAVKKEKPDLVFAFMLSDELDPKVLREIKKVTTSLAWFADDSWRFYNYSRYWAPLFTWVATTYSWTPALFKKYGQPNVLRSQWAANLNTYKPTGVDDTSKVRPDVCFVGGWSKPRQKLVDALTSRGVQVSVFGGGWDGGRVSDEEMLRLFTVSKISLGLNPSPGYFNKNSLGRLFFRRSVNKVVADLRFISNLRCFLSRDIPQIKARHFEIPACGGFVITSTADDLDQYYIPGKEIVIYKDLDDFVQKINYYLKNEEERKSIARAGYERTIREHTYEKRFLAIFRQIGLIKS